MWHNTVELQVARVADLVAPRRILLRLAVTGFGVTLPPAE